MKLKENLETLFLISLIGILPILTFIYLLFFGYPSDKVVMPILVVIGVVGFISILRGANETNNK